MGLTARLPVTVWLAALLATLASGLASAAPPEARAAASARNSAPAGAADEPRSIHIVYHDLDIATPEGIAALYVRIRRAAAELCDANRPVTGTRMIRAEADACVRRAVGATVRQIGVPGLAALDAEQQVLSESAAAPRPACDAPMRTKIII